MRTIVQEAVELKLTMNSSSISLMSFEWSVTPFVDWKGESGTWSNRRTLSIYENVLQPGIIYTISVQGEWPFKHLVLKYTIREYRQ